jgi:hypothetical protein
VADGVTQALAGGAIVVGSGIVGAVLGAIAGGALVSNASGSSASTPAFLGAGMGALVGGSLGVVGGGVVGLGVALFVPEWRAAGLWAAGLVVGLMVVSGVSQAILPPAPSSTSSTPATV